MLEFDWWDQTIFIIFILFGLGGGILNLIQSFNDKYRLEKWYILTKSAAGFYVAVIYLLIWLPEYLNDPWITRQCVRGIVLVASGLWVLDALVRKYRRCWHD